jgi:hypothetical protein
VSEEPFAFFFMVCVVKETIRTVKIEAKDPKKKVGNYLPSCKILFMITGSVSSNFKIKYFSNCRFSISLTFVYLQY